MYGTNNTKFKIYVFLRGIRFTLNFPLLTHDTIRNVRSVLHINNFSRNQHTICEKFIRCQLLSTLDLGHHQVMIQEYEHIHN